MNNPVRTYRAHRDAELSQKQLEELVTELKAKRDELTQRIESLEQQMLIRDDCSHADASDAATAQETRERARGMVAQDRQTISEITAAQRRLETGNFGVSELSGEPIGFKRLLVVPWARTAVDD